MTLKLVIIADDLTGALDTSTPFVEAGLTVAVAVEVGSLAAALAGGPDVVAISTGSRALAPTDATACVKAALAALGDIGSAILFKKIDSRLKGHVAAESTVLAEIANRPRIVVAPAVPDQQRFTVNGAVTGRGVDVPLPVQPLFHDTAFPVTIRDATSDGDLDRLVAETDWAATIAVGARGLGSAFARTLTTKALTVRRPPKSQATFFAFGSRDPITAAQIDHLLEEHPGLLIADAPGGDLELHAISRLPAIARCSGSQTGDPAGVASRFAQGIRRAVENTNPEMIVMGGGDTALAVLRELGISVLVPAGEIEAGIPWFEIETLNGRKFRGAVKSGGFGTIESLVQLLPENLLSRAPAQSTRIKKQAW